VFNDLRTPLTLRAAETLIVGLGEHADNEYLLGSRFLMFDRLDERFETVLCITPRPFDAQEDEDVP
jgi:hypothetical protein